MPLGYLRRLTTRERSERANRHLARYLAFIAGAANAGGWMAVRQYTSHMSGVVAGMADDLALGSYRLVFHGAAALLAFLLGAIATTLCIRWARSRSLESEYALSLLLEAILLAIFAFTAHAFGGERVMGIVLLLCFTMGLQNATITKLSDFVIRTTHLTGMVTDTGIAIGRILYARLTGSAEPITQEIRAIRLLGSLIVLFFVGGVIGAVGFNHVGSLFALPFAAMLVVLAVLPILDDLRRLIEVPA